MHRPLSLLWIALTALASQPAVFDALGEPTTTNILAALSLAQTLTLVSVVTVNWLIYYYVDRRSVELIDSAVDQRFDTDDDEQASRSSGALILAELDELWIADDDAHDELRLPMKEMGSNNNSKDKFLDDLGLIEVEIAASAARRRSSLTLSSSSRRTAPSSSSSSCSSNEARHHRQIFIRGHDEDEGELLTDLMAGYKRVTPTGRSASASHRRTTAAVGAPRGSTPDTVLEWNSSAVTLPIEFNDIDDDNDDDIGDSYGAEQIMTTTTAAVTQRHDEDDDALESLLTLNAKKVSGHRYQQQVLHEAETFVVDVERSVDTPLALRISQGGQHIAEEQPDSLVSFVLPLGRSASFSRRAPPVWSAQYSASVTTLSENERGRQSQDDTEEDPLAFLLTT
ncbi:membrane-associated protein, putative [Bodo saltans]|uniref:Membrane-associated protein, putative n=1 Tax=Bodo saltans TaxID=75058 RepID=A0A0S4IRL9_BODSA|nr:membrane-associated protein, putative [Bodo saltans]|eukprot:CUG02777.1 membrane-associated protein, putative [Bodo saltans]